MWMGGSSGVCVGSYSQLYAVITPTTPSQPGILHGSLLKLEHALCGMSGGLQSARELALFPLGRLTPAHTVHHRARAAD